MGERGITYGKSGGNSGSGLGIYHAKKTIESFGGKFIINSREGLGTEIQLEFPKCDPPDWFVSDLQLFKSQQIIALDDDQSVLEVWRQRLISIDLNLYIKTFTSGEAFSYWMSDKNNSQVETSLFLIDYELLGQNLTGLDLIKNFKLFRNSILVTSRYEEPEIRRRCKDFGIRLIPKTMAGFIPIEVL